MAALRMLLTRTVVSGERGGVLSLSCRAMGSGPKPRRRWTPANCADMVNDLSSDERKVLMAMLEKRQRKEEKKLLKAMAKHPNALEQQYVTPANHVMPQGNGVVTAPEPSQLVLLALHQALPYVGFGFLDNFIMICAGEYIELNIGTSLGIGTMTAAALGNTISDVFGIGSAYYVERWSAMLGFSAPPLTLEQLELPSSRYSAFFGRVSGLTVGCLLGMVPLFVPGRRQGRFRNL